MQCCAFKPKEHIVSSIYASKCFERINIDCASPSIFFPIGLNKSCFTLEPMEVAGGDVLEELDNRGVRIPLIYTIASLLVPSLSMEPF